MQVLSVVSSTDDKGDNKDRDEMRGFATISNSPFQFKPGFALYRPGLIGILPQEQLALLNKPYFLAGNFPAILQPGQFNMHNHNLRLLKFVPMCSKLNEILKSQLYIIIKQ